MTHTLTPHTHLRTTSGQHEEKHSTAAQVRSGQGQRRVRAGQGEAGKGRARRGRTGEVSARQARANRARAGQGKGRAGQGKGRRLVIFRLSYHQIQKKGKQKGQTRQGGQNPIEQYKRTAKTSCHLWL